MEKQKNHGTLTRNLANVWSISSDIIRDIVSLFSLEISLAKRASFIVLTIGMFSFIFLTTFWFFLMAMIVKGLLNTGLSYGLSFFIIAIINFVFLVFSLFVLLFYAKKINVKQTFEQIHSLLDIKK